MAVYIRENIRLNTRVQVHIQTAVQYILNAVFLYVLWDKDSHLDCFFHIR